MNGQLSDMKQMLDDVDDRVTKSWKFVKSSVVNRADNSEEVEQKLGDENLWTIIYILLAVMCMTWVFFCCFCCMLRNRESVQSR